MAKKSLMERANELTGKQWLLLICTGIGAWMLFVLFLVLTVFALIFHNFSQTNRNLEQEATEKQASIQQQPIDPYAKTGSNPCSRLCCVEEKV